jgi:Ca-activated chloride channel family protein
MKLPFRFLTVLSLLASAPFVSAEPSRPGGLPDGVSPGELKVLNIDGKKPDEPLQLPLQHTDVRIWVSGFVARATVTQHYTNPFEAPIEAVYVFPLPVQAAVDGMTMDIGDKVIRGVIKQRDEARKIYEQAKANGKRTSLLEQERPNIFTQSVGNIMPGDAIKVEITYVDILDFRDEGAYELVFPMVVGPRYIPGTATGKGGTGWAPDTDQVPDASRITPPVLKLGERSGHDISLEVDLDAAVAIRGVHSVSHAVDIEEVSASRHKIRLHPSDNIPNKDFVLRYQVAGKAPKFAFITHHTEEQGGFFTFIALPQQQVTDAATVPRDLIFILDTSGSMRGFPLDKSKQAMDRLIDSIRPTDRFNVVRFAGDTGTLWSAPRANTPANVQAAKQFVESLRGAGGTEMRKGIVEALGQPSDPDRMRIAFLLTDGYVGNEAGILRSIEKERRGARIFTLGVGSSVNRYLLDRAATVGRGEAFYVRQDENADAVIKRFFMRVDRPNLAHIEIDWGGLQVTYLTPARIPDLWQGQPITVHGRYQKGGKARVTIRGRLGSEAYEMPVQLTLPENQPDNALMATVWARARVKELMLDMARGRQRDELEERITKLGLDYRIMTHWTSFVAVEEKVVNVDGKLQTMVQPVELPEGVDFEGVFGEAEEAVGAALPAAPMMKSYALPQGVGSAADFAAPGRMRLMRPAVEPYVRQTGEVKQEAAAAMRCQRKAMSVSGGLKYPAVESRLRLVWNKLCQAVQGKYSGMTEIVVEIAVAPDGSVSKVELKPKGKVGKELGDAIREWFRNLSFGPLAQGGTARIKLVLILL